MDNYQFAASLVSSLAWPIAVVIVAIVFRAPIGEMIGRLEHVKGPGFEAWANLAAEAHVALATSTTTPEKSNVPGSLTEKFSELAGTSPSGAVMTAWIDVDKVLDAKIEAAGVSVDKSAYQPKWIVALQAGLITEETATALRKLRDLRNFAAHKHGATVDTARALDFLALADATISAVEQGQPTRK